MVDVRSRSALFLFTLSALILLPQATNAKPMPELAPYFSTGIAAQGRQAQERGDWKAAAALYRKALATIRPREKEQLRFLLAHSLLNTKRYAEAAAIFESLVDSYRLLAHYHLYFAAVAHYRARNFRKCEAMAARVSSESISSARVNSTLAIHWDAALLRADALEALGEEGRAEPIWQDYLKHNTHGKRRGKAHYRLAQIHLARAQGESEDAVKSERRQRAREHLLNVLAEDPLGGFVRKARTEIRKLSRGKLPELNTQQLKRKAQVLYRRMRNKESETHYDELIKRQDLTKAERCQASYFRAKSAFKARQRARAAGLFEDAIKACRDSGSTELEVRSIYNRGRGLFRKGDYQASANEFLSIAKRFPKHSYADDGQLRAAEAFAEAKDNLRVRKLLLDIASRFPDGDMAREALWRLAKMDYLSGNYADALVHLDRSIDKLGHAQMYYAEGRALYWKARAQGKLGKKEASLASYEDAIRQYPLSYYALQAFNRLRQLAPKRFARLKKTLIDPIGKGAGRWRLDKNPSLARYFRNANIRRGIEFARLGFSRYATMELSSGGLSSTGAPSKEAWWLTALLFDRAGAYHLSHTVPRRRERSFKQSYPLGPNYLRWKIAFPQAFAKDVTKNAKLSGIPESLVWAVMREESGFVARAESYANAIGLMQMILPTARAAGRRRKTKVNRMTLQQPEVNIRLGAAFLGWLSQNLSGVWPLVIASYNAGQGATYKWLKEFSSYELDELLEQIPYDQTRRYTKRVLSSLFTYSVLYGSHKEIPRIEQKLPQRGKTHF